MIKFELASGIQSGSSLSDILQRIEEKLRAYDVTMTVAAGAGEVSAAKLESMLRTQISQVYNEGRRQAFLRNADVIQGYMFSAIMDGRETTRCHTLHGKVFTPAQAMSVWPPLHYKCRSIMTGVTISQAPPTFMDAESYGKLKTTPKGYFK